MSNEDLLREVRELGLPLGHYVITASGPMGLRGIRQMKDVDLMVDDELFDTLAARFPEGLKGGKIEVSPRIDAFREAAFQADRTLPSVRREIADADIIDGLPFVRLETVIKLKTAKGRDKDHEDIRLIEEWLANHERDAGRS